MENVGHTQQPKKTRIFAYDALRVFAILTVLLIHALMTSRGIGQTSTMAAFDRWIHYAVPLFVFVSGALIWSRPWENGSYATFVKRRVLRVGPSYLFWSVIFIALLYAGFSGSGALYGNEYNWNGLPTAGVDFLTYVSRIPGYLFSGHSWYHLYFIPMILTFYLLTPLFARALRAFKGSAELTVVAALCFKGLLGPVIFAGLTQLGNPFINSYCTHLVQHLPAMALGGWFGVRMGKALSMWSVRWATSTSASILQLTSPKSGAEKSYPAALREKIPHAAPALFAGTAPMKISSLLWPFAQVALFVIPACLLEPLWQALKKPLKAASELSFGVYYIHALYLLIAQKLSLAFLDPDLWNGFWTSWSGVLLVWAFLIIASYATSWLLSKSPRLRWIIGL